MNNKKKARDHLGNEYESISAMCKHYGMAINTVQNRLSRGWTLEQALTIKHDTYKQKVKSKSGKVWRDHLGNVYVTLAEMCKAYGINEKLFRGRVRGCGWDLEKALTTPIQDTPGNSKQVTDHLGNTFKSVSEMCRYHNIPLTQFKARVRELKWSIEKALTTPKKEMPKIRPVKCKDHLGNEYPSLSAMCKHYGISRYTLQGRLKQGWDLEKALLAGLTACNTKSVKDAAGREFPTLKDMANFYGVPTYRFQNHYRKDKKIEDVIEETLVYHYKNMKIADGVTILKCVEYPYFLVCIGNETENEAVIHLETILSIYHNSNKFEPLTKSKIPHAVKIKRKLGFPWYETEYEGVKCIMSYQQIIELDAKANFGLNQKHKMSSNNSKQNPNSSFDARDA